MRLLHPRISLTFLLIVLAAAGLHAQEPPQEGPGQGGPGMRSMLGPSGGGTAGTVTAISGHEITVKNEQGETYKIETSPNTHFRKERDEAKFADIKVGDTVMAAGNLDDQAKTVGAVFVAILDPQQAARMRQMRADFGKTWTMGKITAIHDLNVTIERPDKVNQTIAVDENTSFRKGGRGPNAEDITFPDVKVGDNVRATGAVQGENFVATQLVVMPAGAMRTFRQRGDRSGEGQTHPQPTPEGTPSGTAPASPQN